MPSTTAAAAVPSGRWRTATKPAGARRSTVPPTSAFLCLRHQIPLMLEKGSGVIVNNASVDGLRGYPFPAARPEPRRPSTAQNGLTCSAALENAKAGLRISAICPGWVDTPAVARYMKDPATKAEILRQTPRGKIASPEEIASSVSCGSAPTGAQP